jgi:type I restriction enzyme S subunit
MELKPGYKQTEAGVIPEDWAIVTLASVTPLNIKNGIVDGPFGSNLKTIHYRNSGIPIITSGYVTDGKFKADKYLYVDQAKFNEEKRSTVRPGDIVMAKIGERCGASAILPASHETGILSGNALKITVDSKRYSNFYIWQILWNLYSSGDIESLKTVGAQPAISMANLKKYKILLPLSKAEQEAIAEALSDTDAWIESLEQLIAKKRQIKLGAMQELLTGKKRLPSFSEKWEVKRLGEICDISMGRTPPRLNSAFWGQGYKWLSIADLKTKVVTESKEEITPLATADMEVIRKGTLLMSFKLSIGRLCFAGCDLYTNEAICSFNNLKANVDFLYYILGRTDFSLYGKQAVKGYTLNKESLKQVEVRLPPTTDEQIAIAEILSEMDTEIAALEAKLAKARHIKQGMMQELLTGRIRLV